MSIERPVTHDDPDVSVVIPTIPANDHGQVVDDLRTQTYDALEVIVVNDPNLSVCEARNVGLAEANGKVVAFTDDDCRPPADWIGAIAAAFEETDDLVIVEGPVRGGMSYDGIRKYPTCNVAVDREAARTADGFDTDFEYWREDTEFGWRMEEHGSSAFHEKMVMAHPDRPRSDIKQENERLLKHRYPEKYERVIVPDTILGKVNYYLWQNGVWKLADRFRYG